MTRRRSSSDSGDGVQPIAKYAEHRGCSRPAVIKAIRDGRISADAAWKNDRGHWVVDVARADRQWADRSTRDAPGVREEQRATSAAAADPAERLLEFGPGSIPVDQNGKPLTRVEVQTIREAALAQRAQLELAELQGALVPSDEVDQLLSELGRTTVDRVMKVPARLAIQMGAEADPAACELMMERALLAAFHGLFEQHSVPA